MTAIILPFRRPTEFREIEIRRTRDIVIETIDGAWETRRTRPPGPGWRILHDRGERHTTWARTPARRQW